MRKRSTDRSRRPALRVRAARVTDMPALMEMMEAFNRHEHITWRPSSMQRALRELLRRPALGMVLLCESEKVPIAYAIATYGYDVEFAGRDAFVTEVFVRAEQRGRGVARTLLAALIARLERAGANAVHLMVRPGNRKARALYESIGFARVPRLLMTRRKAAR